jgi:tetraacyldisaccharide 4'-kinase
MNPAIFGAGISIRNALYDRRILQVNKLARPVVSIGNISVGGSGKTPFVIALGELLKQRGIEFDVLSRGYGRSSTEIALVDPNGSPAQFGDEPLLIARKLQVPVIVGADRYQAGLLAEKQFSSKLHLLDDGFQHRRLHRDFDIVLLPREDMEGALLPVGRLREPVRALRRADTAVVCEPLEFSRVQTEVWLARRTVTLSETRHKAVVFCGIARSGQFFKAVGNLGQIVVGQMAFRDHHRYQQRDIDRLLRLKSNTGADGFITTEKDLINLGALSTQLQPLCTAELRMQLEAPDKALTLLFETIEQRSGCRL